MAAGLTAVLGAAASAVHPMLMGPVRGGSVLGAFSQAVVVGVHTEAGPRAFSLLAMVIGLFETGYMASGAADGSYGLVLIPASVSRPLGTPSAPIAPRT